MIFSLRLMLSLRLFEKMEEQRTLRYGSLLLKHSSTHITQVNVKHIYEVAYIYQNTY